MWLSKRNQSNTYDWASEICITGVLQHNERIPRYNLTHLCHIALQLAMLPPNTTADDLKYSRHIPYSALRFYNTQIEEQCRLLETKVQYKPRYDSVPISTRINVHGRGKREAYTMYGAKDWKLPSLPQLDAMRQSISFPQFNEVQRVLNDAINNDYINGTYEPSINYTMSPSSPELTKEQWTRFKAAYLRFLNATLDITFIMMTNTSAMQTGLVSLIKGEPPKWMNEVMSAWENYMFESARLGNPNARAPEIDLADMGKMLQPMMNMFGGSNCSPQPGKNDTEASPVTPEAQTKYSLNETIAACDALLLQYDLEQQLAMTLTAERGNCATNNARLNEDLKSTPVIDINNAPPNTLEELPEIYPVEASNKAACGLCARRVRCCKDSYMSWIDQKVQSEVCEEFASPCQLPLLPDGTCDYAPTPTTHKHDKQLAERMRVKHAHTLGVEQPSFNCARSTNGCHCCCGPYTPIATNERDAFVCRKA